MPNTINNYTCKRCKNNKCNSNEKSCWKCGEIIDSSSSALEELIKIWEEDYYNPLVEINSSEAWKSFQAASKALSKKY